MGQIKDNYNDINNIDFDKVIQGFGKALDSGFKWTLIGMCIKLGFVFVDYIFNIKL
jgi:hypothetical protein